MAGTDSTAGKYEFLDHTADVLIHAWGDDLREVFENAATAITAYISDIGKIEITEKHPVEVEADDLNSLLYKFLDEVLYLFNAEPYLLSKRVRILEFSNYKIKAECYGEPFSMEKHDQGTEIKAITYSAMNIIQGQHKSEFTESMMEFEKKPEDTIKQSLRLEVLNVMRSGPQRLELETRDIESTSNKAGYKVIIEGIWTQSRMIEHSIIHLVNPDFDKETRVYSINNSSGLLVIEPDNLLTCTLVASSLFCERKTWLNHVFLGQVGTNRAMLVGTLVHEVFQHGVRNRCADLAKLTEFLDELLDDATVMLEIYSVELHLNDVRAEAKAYITSVKEWIEKFMLAGPRHALDNDSDLEVKVIGVSDIEENVWSTKYGLKGKIDVTGAVRVYDRRTKSLKDKTLPLELKTGNSNLSASHAAQVSLYSMMIEDRYAETNQGLVIYLKDKAAMHNVRLTHNIKRDLVRRRNQLNYYLKNHYFGPEMIDQPRMCKGCDRLTECILMSKLYDKDLENHPAMMTLKQDAIGHLDEKFEEFFKIHHERLVGALTGSGALNGSDQHGRQITKGSFWTHTSSEAETRGTGFGKLQAHVKDGLVIFKRHPNCKENLLLMEHKLDTGNGIQPPSKKVKINDYFKPKKSGEEIPSKKYKPFNTTTNTSRCRVAISIDSETVDMESKNSSTAISIGFIQDLKDDQIVMKIYEGSLNIFQPNFIYRLDIIEKKNNLEIERLVLVRLLTRDDWRCDRVRQLILDPSYTPKENIDMNLFVLDSNFEEISELDERLQKVVVEAVSSDNYYVITEMQVAYSARITRLVYSLAKVISSFDRSVLIVAPTIDQLCDLMRLLQKSVKFILIDDGKSTKARYTFASNLVKVPQGVNLDLTKKFDHYIRLHEKSPVVITTYAMSSGGLQFTRRTFDYCIALECDKTELLTSLSPMFCSDRHIIFDIRDKSAARETTNHKDSSLGDHLRRLRPPVLLPG